MKLHNDYEKDNSDDDEDSMFGSFNPNLNTKDSSTNYRIHGTINRSSYETISKFSKTGSYLGLLMLEKAPDEFLLNGYNKDNEQVKVFVNNVENNKKYFDFELERTIV